MSVSGIMHHVGSAYGTGKYLRPRYFRSEEPKKLKAMAEVVWSNDRAGESGF